MSRYTWPDGQHCVAFFSVHFDAESFDLKTAGNNSLFGRYSYGRYGTRAGFPRLIELLDRLAIKATFFVPAADARRHPDLIRTLIAHGHELAARGVDLEDLDALGDKEPAVLKDSRNILADIAGKAPVGFRAPRGAVSPRTLNYLAELGFLYDSSFQDGDYPYLIDTTAGRPIVEIPTNAALEDAPAYSARHTHDRVIQIWRDEFEANYQEGVLVPIIAHLRGDIGSTRAARIAALEKLLQDMRQSNGLAFMTGQALAEHTETLGLAAEPDPLVAHLATLKVTPYRGDLSVKPI
ncbi:MAG: polysaccharide deacetylase family protein [Burkholderiaceae bacterium]